jgi:hypothetical protein
MSCDMNAFQEIGDIIESQWRSKDYDESAFPALAADVLRKACLPGKIDAWQVLEWTLQQIELPRQRDVQARFGEPPITLYSGPRFHVDVYFWFHGTTSIHQHGFCGAFQVLHGSSIHSWYEFELREKINSFCEIGEMRLKTCDLLNVGDVQEILPGRQYIHSLFHLDHPSVTIVVRTDKSPLFLPQFDYHKPGLATDPFFEQDTTVKKLQSIDALLAANRMDADEQISALLESADFHTVYLILSAVHGRFSSNSVEQMFGGGESRRRFDALLTVAEKQRTGKGDILRQVFTHHERVQDLVRRRSFVDNPEHRFFFALLLNVEGRERIFALIRNRFPDSDPVEKILDWSYDLSQMRLAGVQNQNALGISPFDDFDLQLVEYLLRGKTDGEIANIVREIYPPEKAEQILPTLSDRTMAIRSSIVFSPLMGNEN